MTTTATNNAATIETIGLDDYVACTIEGRVIQVSETHDGKKFLVEYFDNFGVRRVRSLWQCEIELEDEPDAAAFVVN